MSNVQITHSSGHQARADIAVAAHPTDPNRLVVAAKHVPSVSESATHVDVRYSVDAGVTWTSAPVPALPAGASGTLSPSLVWDNAGNVFLAVGARASGTADLGSSIHVYKSVDGGASWSTPTQVDVGHDFPALACDRRTGTLYLVGWEPVTLRCAHTIDGGATWSLTMSGGAVAVLNDNHNGFFYEVSPPSIAVGNETATTSTVLVAWYSDGLILAVQSTNGGVSFSAPANIGASAMDGPLPITLDGDVHFPHLGDESRYVWAPSCAANGQTFAIAWTHPLARRLVYRIARGGGLAPLFSSSTSEPQALVSREATCFNPQLACAADGTVGCLFYELKAGSDATVRVDVRFVVLPDEQRELAVADNPWQPTTGAYVVNHHADTRFALDPVGLAASSTGIWHAVWPDTRTGLRELWTRSFHTPPKLVAPDHGLRAIVHILFGIIQDGPGVTVPGGRVPPYGPAEAVLLAAVATSLAERLQTPHAPELRRAALQSLAAVTLRELAKTGTTQAELLSLLAR